MIITTSFGHKAHEQAVLRTEKDAFSHLRKLGLFDYAKNAFERFADQMDFTPSRHTQNAYLLQYSGIVKNNPGALDPTDIEFILQSHLRGVKLITEHGNEYLKKQNHPDLISDDLTTAAIATPAFLGKPSNTDLIGLIGPDAFKLMGADQYLLQHDGLQFHDSSFSSEARALHLTSMIMRSENILGSMEHQISQGHKIDPLEIEAIKYYADHIDNINPIPKRSALDDIAYAQLLELEKSYDTLKPRLCEPADHTPT